MTRTQKRAFKLFLWCMCGCVWLWKVLCVKNGLRMKKILVIYFLISIFYSVCRLVGRYLHLKEKYTWKYVSLKHGKTLPLNLNFIHMYWTCTHSHTHMYERTCECMWFSYCCTICFSPYMEPQALWPSFYIHSNSCDQPPNNTNHWENIECIFLFIIRSK